MIKKTLHQLKPGMIFKIIDDMKYQVDSYGKKGTVPKRIAKTSYLEEWHAVVDGPYQKITLYTILFKQIKTTDGKDTSSLKEGDSRFECIPRDIYDDEPPTEISIIEGKELRMIIDENGQRAKLVNKQ